MPFDYKSLIAPAIGAGAGILQGGLSFVSSGHSAYKNFKYTSALQRQQADLQYNYTRRLNQNAYQDTVSSMRNAGINPMLAVSQGVNGLSSGSAAASFNSADPDYAQAVNTALQYKQIKSSVDLNETQEDVNRSQEDLNQYLADVAHENAANINELTRQLQMFGPLKEKALIENSLANTAKAIQEIKNSKALTQSMIDVNSAQAKYTNERARGYSNSESYSSSDDNTLQSGTFKLGPFSNTKPTQVSRYGHSRSRSRTY